MFPADLLRKAEDLVASCRPKGILLATAESCTGGLVAALLTSIAGSSDVFERGFVTYSNRAKEDSLGVDPDLIARFGAVSAEVAAPWRRRARAFAAADRPRRHRHRRTRRRLNGKARRARLFRRRPTRRDHNH